MDNVDEKNNNNVESIRSCTQTYNLNVIMLIIYILLDMVL